MKLSPLFTNEWDAQEYADAANHKLDTRKKAHNYWYEVVPKYKENEYEPYGYRIERVFYKGKCPSHARQAR